MGLITNGYGRCCVPLWRVMQALVLGSGACSSGCRLWVLGKPPAPQALAHHGAETLLAKAFAHNDLALSA